MPVDCQHSPSGGKGNLGMFYERSPNICAAGMPTAQPSEKMGDLLQHYLMQEEVDSLISDAIIPPPKPRPLPPLRHPIPKDTRFAAASYTEVAQLINPPDTTKFQALVDDLKETIYNSYWRKALGKVPDPVPMLPKGLDPIGVTFGKKTPFHGRLYDVVMPKVPIPDKTPASKRLGARTNRKYCPPYDSNLFFGHKTHVDHRGINARCCLTDDRVKLGTSSRVVMNSIQADRNNAIQSRLGTSLAPNDNIQQVPDGHTFGKLEKPCNVKDCLIYCNSNQGKDDFRKCFTHLNSLRRCLSTRYLPSFFHNLYLSLKHFDKDKSGWLPREVVYDYCGSKLLRFDPALLEPLLSMWQAFDGSKVEYKTFVHMINYREPSVLPKILDLEPSCLDYRTTYTEMVKLNQPVDRSAMAGVPSGRYFDLDYPVTPERCCKADTSSLPHESDMWSCLNPSVFTRNNVSHRDMYAKRDPETVRRVFEASGEIFTNESFDAIWKDATKYHSQGWVCFETFRKALKNANSEN